MGGGHLADMRKLRKRGAKLQDVVDFFLKKVNLIVNSTKVWKIEIILCFAH